MFKDSRRRRLTRVRTDVRDLDDWNDTISSVQVRTRQRRRARAPPRATEPEQVIRRAYQDILQQEPDTAGMRTYRTRMIDNGWTEQDVRQALQASAEYRELNTMTMAGAQETVRQAYLAVLKREPDAASRPYVEAIYRR